jgi:hypothetical protein
VFVRRFEERDAKEVSSIICRNSLEVNIVDYPLAQMQAIVDKMTPTHVSKLAAVAHTYVACDDGIVVGTGTVDCWWGSETESMLRMLFVLPERHGQGADDIVHRFLPM